MNKPDISKMTLREKIGQMFIMRDDRLHDMVSNDDIAEYLKNNPIGGIWATGRLKKPAAYLNFEASSEGGELYDLKEYVNLLNSCLNIPLLVGGDSEKGGFMGSSEIAGPDAVVAANDDELAYRYGACMAKELATGGLNWRWSPICDLAHPQSSSAVNRVCSDVPEKIVKYAKAMIKGTQDSGVAATVKHFPGHDLFDTKDPHFSPGINNSSLEDWLELQGRVYKESIDSGVYSVMIGHAAFPAVDDSLINGKRRPSTFSKKIITDLLKDRFGFDGVVITDDIGMRAAFSIFGKENMADTYVELINAGNDMLLGTPIGEKHEDYIGYIEKAVAEGRVSIERIEDACRRILTMKEKLGLFGKEEKLADIKTFAEETNDMNMDIARKSLTLLANKNNLIPLDAKTLKKVSIIPVTHSDFFPGKLEELKKAFERRGMEAKIYDNAYQCNLREAAKEDGVIIYANFVSAHQPMGHCTFFGNVAQQFFKILSYGSDRSVVVSFGSPFIKEEYYEETETYINAYWYNKETMEALVDALMGDIPFVGKSPFNI